MVRWPPRRFAFGGGHDFFNFFDAAEDGAEGDEFGARAARDHASESGLAAAGRAPQDHRGDLVVFDLLAQGFAGAEEFFLADEFVESAGAHALGERAGARSLRGWVVGGWRKGSRFRLGFFQQRIALAGGFVEQNGSGSGGVERFDAASHGDANSRVGAAFDFFGETGAFVAD